MRSLLIIVILFLSNSLVIGQSFFEDGLEAEWYSERRGALREKMPENSMAIFFNNPIKNRSNDVDFIYHPNTDFFYLTGFREPNSILVVFSEKRDFGTFSADEIIYVQNRDPRAEMWNGKRLGVEGVKEFLGFEYVFLNSDFGEKPALQVDNFDKVLTFNLGNEIEESSANAPLIRMVSGFKENVNYPGDLSEMNMEMYKMILATDIDNAANVAQIIGRYRHRYPEVGEDQVLVDFLEAETPEQRMKIKESVPEQKVDLSMLPLLMDALRGVKTPEEQVLLAKAAKISAIGQIEVMKAAKVGMSEREVQGVHEFIYKRYGSEGIGYPSIVGAGNNGCILHYIENDLKSVDQRLLLMDLGAEWRGYTADVTRTIPISGRFTKEEKAIYELVFKSQEAGIELCKEGVDFSEIGSVTREIINEGLADLGIIEVGERHDYFPHGTSHHLGLDVHDRGEYGPLKNGMVLTVEPGIYIPEGSDCDPKWWGIAVRIEDDILVSANGPVNLSIDAPRTVAAIEEMMSLPSVLENWVLPEIQ